MAKYRPIAPDKAWRSTTHCDVDIVARYLEFYFLTSPFTNAIGCYPIALAIACAETGIRGVKKLLKIMDVLKERNIIDYEGDHILVRTWFQHNFWQATLQGNVAKLAEKEIEALPPALREKWINSSASSGVPMSALTPFLSPPVPSPFVEAPKELPNNNSNHKPEQNKNTTTPPNPAPDVNGLDCGGSEQLIVLTELAEPYREYMSQTLEGLPPADAQRLADEVCGALENAAKGLRDPIQSLQNWLPTLVNKLHSKTFLFQAGIPIAKRREESEKTAAKVIETARTTQDCQAKSNASFTAAELLLGRLDPDELKWPPESRQ